jgi:hypothetical protein
LEQHFRSANGAVLTITKNSLVENGFNEVETNKIMEMLSLCERFIYSPFDEDFDQPKCNELVTELTNIIKSKKV